jgi:hypothetical protein
MENNKTISSPMMTYHIGRVTVTPNPHTGFKVHENYGLVL